MTEPTTVAADLANQDFETESEVIARVSARPVEFTAFSEDDNRASRFIATPPGWDITEVIPEDFRHAPEALTGTYAANTAEGFATLVKDLSDNATDDVRYTATLTRLTALIDRGSYEHPAHEGLVANLIPHVSRELGEWLDGRVARDLKQWIQWVEDHTDDIDAATDVEPRALSGADVVADARNWNVESRRAYRQMNSEAGEVDEKAEFESKVVGSAIASFQIYIPVLQWGEPQLLTVALTRDLENATITPRLPGIERVIERATLDEITKAEGLLDVEAIR